MPLTRRKFSLACSAIFAGGLLSTPAAAHREKTTLSEVVWDEESGFLYVTHSFHTHEAEQALFEAGLISTPKFESLRARAQLAIYTETQFALQTLTKQAIGLELLGAEIDGPDIFVFQQAKMDAPPKGLFITCTLLRGLIPDQINHVDIRLAGPTRSLDFRGHEHTKKALA
jgi:hypothetical protein